MLDICSKGPVIPVIEIDDVADARPLAEALVRGGITVIEITLRTSAALDAIERVSDLDIMSVGAGTLLSPEQVRDVKQAGATFGISPGATDKLVDACNRESLPFLPGASTASEVMRLRDMGFSVQKFFPAEAAGGVAMLKSIGGPIQDISFCPTGGVTQSSAPGFLQLPNVVCVGGSWIAPRSLIAAKYWTRIEENARAAQSLTLSA